MFPVHSDINRITVEFKFRQIPKIGKLIYILIESQWNLNRLMIFHNLLTRNINRITVEFKYFATKKFGWHRSNINRITVEFKLL